MMFSDVMPLMPEAFFGFNFLMAVSSSSLAKGASRAESVLVCQLSQMSGSLFCSSNSVIIIVGSPQTLLVAIIP